MLSLSLPMHHRSRPFGLLAANAILLASACYPYSNSEEEGEEHHDGGHHAHDGGHHTSDGGHHTSDGGHHTSDGGHHTHDAGHHTPDAGHHMDDGGTPVPGGDPWASAGWPAEPRGSATRLFTTGSSNLLGQNNWSGAHWNPQTNTLWVCRNNYGVRAYRYDGSQFTLLRMFEIAADFEGITQADLSGDNVYLLAENDQEIRHYNLSGTAATLIESWLVEDLISAGDGLEGIVFVPNAVLASSGFVAGDGAPFDEAAGAAGGLFLVSSQHDGNVFALDLLEEGNHEVVGQYSGPLNSTRGLELDRTNGMLFMVDGQGTARVRLSSSGSGAVRAFEVVNHYPGPGPAGAEGIAVTPANAPETWAIITDDDNAPSDSAILWYTQFRGR